MGDGEYNNLTFYTRNNKTGEMFVIGGIKDIELISEDPKAISGTVSYEYATWDGGTVTLDLTAQETNILRRRFFPESFNNYRKLHGMPLIRKRWHG